MQEKHENVMKAMQSVLISSHQALLEMKSTGDLEFYESENVRVYLKTRKRVFLGNYQMDYSGVQMVSLFIKDGNSLDVNGNIVPYDSPAGHIPR
jgi:hypothetical protein